MPRASVDPRCGRRARARPRRARTASRSSTQDHPQAPSTPTRRRHGLDGDHDDPAAEPEPPEPEPVGDRQCWRTFGADPRRSLARPDATLGLPARKFTWTRGLGSYIEYPPVLLRRRAVREQLLAGRHSRSTPSPGKVRWTRRVGGTLPSSPAIDGPRILVALAGRHRHGARPARRATALAGARPPARSSRRPSSSTGPRSSARTTAGCSQCARRRDTSAGRTRPAGASTRARRCSAAACASRRTQARSSASIAGRARRVDDVR